MSATNNQKRNEEIKNSLEKVNSGLCSSAISKNFNSNNFLNLCKKRILQGKTSKTKIIN